MIIGILAILVLIFLATKTPEDVLDNTVVGDVATSPTLSSTSSPLSSPSTGSGQAVLRGFIKNSTGTDTRPRLSVQTIQSFLPERGKFVFPFPYNTESARITNASDCGNTDCVNYAGYSYWRNMNNHAGRNEILIFVGLKHNYGGPTLYSYNKSTGAVAKVGPLFDKSSAYSYSTAEGWYWSAKEAYKIYVWRADSKLSRYDVNTKQFETVLDVANRTDLFGGNKYIWQMHSSDDDKVHAGTLRDSISYATLGCFAYEENTKKYSYYPEKSQVNECNLDGSGQWLLMIDGEDNRVIDLATGSESMVADKEGALGHLDMGYGYAVGSDNYHSMPNATVLIKFPLTSTTRPVGDTVHTNPNWRTAEANHVSHQNRKPDSLESQYACGSNIDNEPRENEIVCFKLDGSLKTLVVAPVMSNLTASGGGDAYGKFPKGNLDVTGEYFFWTSNMGGSRLDAFIVRVPYIKL